MTSEEFEEYIKTADTYSITVAAGTCLYSLGFGSRLELWGLRDSNTTRGGVWTKM